jgi:CheY-like chemotaxis protein
MVRLVDDLLEVSRITRGKIELRKETVNLSELVKGAVDMLEAMVDSGHQELVVTLPAEPVLIEGDPVRLSQIINNLLNNALKYTEDTGRIWLTVTRDDHEAVFSVRDTGVGIPPQMLPRVFELFTQVDRTLGRSQGGLGIGLALVKSLVEMHGGSVEARSEGIGKGSEFLVRLPPSSATMDSGEGPDQAQVAGQTLNRLRIAVVDDNRDAADSLAMLLRMRGADVRTNYDGGTALRTLETFPADVVLLDLGMPGIDGFQVAARLRAAPQTVRTKLIALTGWGQEEDQRRVQAAGFDAHLVKPVDPLTLIALLESSKNSRDISGSIPKVYPSPTKR